MGTYTYTYAIVEVSKATFDEIASKLKEAGSEGAFTSNGNVIDMHGLALRIKKDDEKPESGGYDT